MRERIKKKKKKFSLRFFLRFTEIGPSDFVGINTESALRDEATREYQKHEISPRIQVNIRKILVFCFSQMYGVLLVP